MLLHVTDMASKQLFLKQNKQWWLQFLSKYDLGCFYTHYRLQLSAVSSLLFPGSLLFPLF